MSVLHALLLVGFVVFVVAAALAFRTRAYKRGPRGGFWDGGGFGGGGGCSGGGCGDGGG